MATLGLVGAGCLAIGALCLGSGCSSAGYYWQSARGHLAIMRAAQPVSDWLDDPTTPAPLKARLELSQRLRDFAVTELKEPDNASYRRYADLHRSAALWNVVAAPELSLDLHTWCFLVVGCVGYRGYYDEASARRFADGLRADGLEVEVYGVPAYSTLGKLPGSFFADPLLNTFIGDQEADLARLIFHELAHQIAFAPGDTVFNESFATAVETLGGDLWMQTRATAQSRAASAAADLRRRDFRELVGRYRDALREVYASGASDDEKRERKRQTMARLREEYATLKRERWGGYAGYDDWFDHANNASLGVLAAYNQLLPNFERLFDRQGRDWTRFYAEVRRLASLPFDQRRAALP